MSQFFGYAATIIFEDHSEKLITMYVKDLLEQGVDMARIPYCPLAAVGYVLDQLSPNQRNSFDNNQLLIRVFNPANFKDTTTYNSDYLDYELKLEELAG